MLTETPLSISSFFLLPRSFLLPPDVQRDLVFRIISDPSKTGQITGDMVSIESSGAKQAVLKLKTAGAFDFENAVSYEVVIEAEDGGNIYTRDTCIRTYIQPNTPLNTL